MIGNDLVAFEACRNYSPQRWLAYWSKILTDTEWERFPTTSNNPRAWLYWAAKEAAWKVWFRHSAQRLLNPKAFVVDNVHWEGSCVSFDVLGPTEIYQGYADLSQDYLHTVVAEKTESFPDRRFRAFSVSKVFPKEQLLFSLNSDKELSKTIVGLSALESSPPKPQFSLSRNILGIPSLEIEGNVLDLPISLSHHGSWAAYAYVYSQRTLP